MGTLSEGSVVHRRRWATAAAALVVAASAVLLPAGGAGAGTTPTVPANLVPPSGNVLYLVGHARGYQIYTCQSTANGYAWVLREPWAGLVDDSRRYVALHYGGPTWRSPDGSAVVAARIASAPAPSSTAIPWLLLQATSHSGPAGTFSATTFIQRINTTGGLAPSTGCDASRVGATAAVRYTADYYFYRAG